MSSLVVKCRPVHCIFDASLNDINNGYTVMRYKLQEVIQGDIKIDTDEDFNAVGYYLAKIPNSIVTLEGEWVKDKKNGEQFKVDTCKEEIEKNKDAIIQFLSSGLIRGVGKITANKIYAKFGNSTLDILDNDIDKLLEVGGITKVKLKKIKQSYSDLSGAREIISYLGQFGISPKISQKVYQMIPDINDIKNNPYSLLKVKKISFNTADIIAIHQKLDMHSLQRIKAATYYILVMNEVRGHTGMPKINLCKGVKNILNTSSNKQNFVSDEEIVFAITKMIENKEIIPNNGNYFRKAIFDCEIEINKNIVRLFLQGANEVPDLEQKLSQWETENNTSLDEIQRNAVTTALTQGFCVITGGPGRGKTTISKAINALTKANSKTKNVVLLAPTGRAARRLAESTGEEASTIHKGLCINKSDGLEDYESDMEIEAEHIIVDESSMIDVWLMRTLLKAVKNGTKVTLVGDPDQLPSVGSGAVLRDIIKSGVVPVVELKKIYRQAEGSIIIENSEKIKKGIKDIEFNNTDFIGYGCKDSSTAVRYSMILYKKAIEKYGIKNVMLLSPFHHAKNPTSVDNINRGIQEMLNPNDGRKKEVKHGRYIYREGDIVMQTVNKDAISNGDVGSITAIYTKDGDTTIEVTFFTGEVVEYDKSNLDILELAYAMSIHKSQGSEAECVILILLKEHGVMLKRNLLYTAVTRASKRFCFVGDIEAMNKAIDTIDTEFRITLLAVAIKQYFAKVLKESIPFMANRE